MSEKFSTSNAPRGGLSPEVKQWSENSDPEDQATLVFRLPSYADPKRVAADLVELGVEPESVGESVITGRAASKDVRRTIAISEILSVELPEKLSPKSDSDVGDLLSGKALKSPGYKLPE